MRKGYIILLTLSATLCHTAFAAIDKPILGEPTLTGSGCGPGTVSWVLSPEGETLSILFDEYQVEAGNGTPSVTKTCSMNLPIQIPSGFYLRIYQVDYRGFNSLPVGGSSTFTAEYQFQGGADLKKKKIKSFKGPLLGDFIETTREQVRSPCGRSNLLMVRTILSVQSNAQQDQAISQIDSKDLSTPRGRKERQMQYRMQLRRCGD